MKKKCFMEDVETIVVAVNVLSLEKHCSSCTVCVYVSFLCARPLLQPPSVTACLSGFLASVGLNYAGLLLNWLC